MFLAEPPPITRMARVIAQSSRRDRYQRREWRYAALRERGAPQVELRQAEKDGVLDVRFRS